MAAHDTIPFIIGISGGSGSGKTLLVSKLKEKFGAEQVCFISQDEYYKEKQYQQKDENGIENFDLPTAIDQAQLYKDIQSLRSGEQVQKKEYTFNNPALVPRMLTFVPAPVLVIEGIFVFHFEEICSLLDLSVFIHTKKELKLARRITRDAEERGYDLEHVLYSQKNHINPAYRKYIKPYRHEADVVVPNNEKGFDKALDLLVVKIQSVLNQNAQ
jgi:uridine kinase